MADEQKETQEITAESRWNQQLRRDPHEYSAKQAQEHSVPALAVDATRHEIVGTGIARLIGQSKQYGLRLAGDSGADDFRFNATA